jgi:hypothetical protein
MALLHINSMVIKEQMIPRAMTQKEIISEIREEQKTMAAMQYRLAADLSTFFNKQELFNQRISDILDNDEKTDKKGLVYEVGELSTRIDKIELKEKVTAGKIAVTVTILTFIGGVVLKAINIFD